MIDDIKKTLWASAELRAKMDAISIETAAGSDIVLPRLISGDLRIPDAETIVEEAAA